MAQQNSIGLTPFAGANTQTLTANITLVEDSPMYQLITVDASTRNCNLPLSPTVGTTFVIKNNTAFNSSNGLIITHNGQNIDVLYPNSTNIYVFDGTYWQGIKWGVNYTGVGSEEYNTSSGYAASAYNNGAAFGSNAQAYSLGVAVGRNSEGYSNGVAIGYDTEGVSGIAIGYAAGNNITSATGNLLIGYNIDAQSTTVGGELSIGNVIFGEGGTFGTSTAIGTMNIGIGVVPASNSKLEVAGSLSLIEKAAADADTATYGQIWVKSDTPNTLWFTDDAGTDVQLGAGFSFDTNKETLAATKTLSSGDETYQVLDCNGANRDVGLPLGYTGETFWIQNNSSVSVPYTLTVKYGPNTLDTLYASDCNGYYYDGSNWQGINYSVNFNGVSSSHFNTSLGNASSAYGYGTAIGNGAIGFATGVAIGRNSEGYSNGVAIGYEAEGHDNSIAVGYQCGDNITSATGNLLIGYDIDAQSTTAGTELSIGNVIFGDDGTFGTGTSVGTMDIGIGVVPSGDFKLEVAGGLGYQKTIENSTTTPVTLTTADSGKVYTITGAAANITFNLPAAAAGLTYSAVSSDGTDALVFDAQAGDYIWDGSSQSASGGNIGSTTDMSAITLLAIDDTNWIVMCKTGTWGLDG